MMEGWKGYESEVDVVRHVVQFWDPISNSQSSQSLQEKLQPWH